MTMSRHTASRVFQRGEADLCSLEVACQTFDQTSASALEELFDFGDVVGAAIGWERVEESGAVARGADARVEQHENAAVGEGADEAAETLLECDDGLRDLEVVEGIAAAGGDGVGAGLHDGVGGDGEGEFVDDDAGELLALHVDSLPEG